MREAVFLLDHGKSPYQGDVYHQNPLQLLLARGLLQISPLALPAALLVIDLLACYLLAQLALVAGAGKAAGPARLSFDVVVALW